MLSKTINSTRMMSLKAKMLSRAGATPVATSARGFAHFGGQEGSTVS
jgi:hypothetical protein